MGSLFVMEANTFNVVGIGSIIKLGVEKVEIILK